MLRFRNFVVMKKKKNTFGFDIYEVCLKSNGTVHAARATFIAEKLEYDTASGIRGLRESIQLTELKNFRIALSVFMVVDSHI